MSRDLAPVVAAEVFIHHGLDKERNIENLARTRDLDEADAVAAVHAAHVLIQREHPQGLWFVSELCLRSVCRVRRY